jgi:hypothetical protein
MMMALVCSSETSEKVFRKTQRYNPGYSPHCEYLKRKLLPNILRVIMFLVILHPFNSAVHKKVKLFP